LFGSGGNLNNNFNYEIGGLWWKEFYKKAKKLRITSHY
jgi:hypothetical protein